MVLFLRIFYYRMNVGSEDECKFLSSRFNKVNPILFILLRISNINTKALGDIIEESSGKLTGERVLDVVKV